MEEIYVHPHAFKHGLTEAEIRFAWVNYVRMRARMVSGDVEIVAVGVTRQGVVAEMVGVRVRNGVLVFHASAPPTANVLRELGMLKRR